TGKNMTPAEVKALNAAGLAVVTVDQEGKASLLKGKAYGVEAAKRARRIAGPCGMPNARPVYFALDIDPNPLTTAQWAAVKAFLVGAARGIGAGNVGIYGGYKAIETLVPTWAPWGWQTYAWSGGKWSTK